LWPSPGGISFTPKTVALLPALNPLPPRTRFNPVDGKHHLPAARWVGKMPAAPHPLHLICFPKISDRPTSELHPLPRAVALAELMAQSIDRWHQAALPHHLTALQQLCQQAPAYRLHLGQDVAQLPALLTSHLSS